MKNCFSAFIQIFWIDLLYVTKTRGHHMPDVILKK